MGASAARAGAQGRGSVTVHSLNVLAWAAVATCGFAVVVRKSRPVALSALGVSTAIACLPFFIYATHTARTDYAADLISWVGAAEGAAIVALVALIRLPGRTLPAAAVAVASLALSGTASFLIDHATTLRDARALAPWLPASARNVTFDDGTLTFETDASVKPPCALHGQPYRQSCALDDCTTLTLLHEGSLVRAIIARRECH